MIFLRWICIFVYTILCLLLDQRRLAVNCNNIRAACRTIPGLTRDQLDLCHRANDVTAVALSGLDLAVRECQTQFQWHRWNCSSLGNGKNRNPHNSMFLRKGYRESSFVYAISAAGVTYSVAKACSQGRLVSCGCDSSLSSKQLARYLKESSRGASGSSGPMAGEENPGANRNAIVKLKGQILNETRMPSGRGTNPKSASRWKWGGCSHNMNFGIAFSEMFLDASEKAGDIQSKINLHNNHAGRLAITNYMQVRCKCHGMSGSCQLKTCWKSAPDFRVVGTALKQMFRRAILVDQSNKGNGAALIVPSRKRSTGRGGGVGGGHKWSRQRRRECCDPASPRPGAISSSCDTDQPTERAIMRPCGNVKRLEGSLFYYERSPNFCERDPQSDIMGTAGRRCNRTGTGNGSCSTMCCGRGYVQLTDRRVEKCRCKFHWCCEVQCDECVTEQAISVCN